MMTATDRPSLVSRTIAKGWIRNSKSNGTQFAFPMLAIAVLILTAEAAIAACPTNVASSPPRWSFTTIDWVYSGGLSSTQVGAGATAWNSRQSFTSVQAGSTYLVWISTFSTTTRSGQISEKPPSGIKEMVEVRVTCTGAQIALPSATTRVEFTIPISN